jgi:hypothetical protein
MLFDKEQSLFHRLKILFSLLPFGSPHFTLVKIGIVNSVPHSSLVLKKKDSVNQGGSLPLAET